MILRTIALVSIVVVAGCAGAPAETSTTPAEGISTPAEPDTGPTHDRINITTTETPTATSTENGSINSTHATAADARRFERSLQKYVSNASVAVSAVGGNLWVYWETPNPSDIEPETSESLGNMSRSEGEFTLILLNYITDHNRTVNGSLVLTATHDDRRVATWFFDERYLLDDDHMTPYLEEQILSTRVNHTDPTEGST